MDFWARRKAAVEAEAQAEEAQRAEEAVAAREAVQADKTDAELLEELGLPEPETLGPDDDFKAFLADGVPQRLKTRALRCLWRSNPILANVDGLVDYGEDFTDAACVIENLQTAYQVGKGMLAHVEEMARQAEAAANPEPEGEAVESVDVVATLEESDSEDELAQIDVPEASVETASTAPTDWDAPEEAALPPRRRMAFTFDETTA